jgi:hypothetical protein
VSEGTGCTPRGRCLSSSDGPPFRWDENRRFLIRAELDAAFFHLYLPADANGDWVKAESESEEDLKRLKESFPKPRDAVSYIMDTFPIVKRKDEAAYGSYRTQEMILAIYDEMQEAMRTGGEYRTRLGPAPGIQDVATLHVRRICIERGNRAGGRADERVAASRRGATPRSGLAGRPAVCAGATHQTGLQRARVAGAVAAA